MPPYSKKTKLNIRKKNRRKVIAVICQTGVLVLLAIIIVRALFIIDSHKPLSTKELTNTDGFIALSYFGVDRSGSPKYVAKGELEKQLTTLKEQGFETISQQQVIDFYEKGAPLPKKALFLSFEDGRNDSSIFSQNILEKLNYKATMFTYANKMEAKDPKFLNPIHLKEMIESGYWELGSNGYRLTYINVFNGKGGYLGEIDENNVPDKTSIEYYNHYLMDFLRDEYMIPKETRLEMQRRIATDYEQMFEIYTKEFSSSPKAYAIMHANTLFNNMHTSVESVNDKMIKKYFSLHFNRDLNAYNSADDDVYDLNRLQVSPNWSMNHLLMKIKADSKGQIDFETGDLDTARKWSVNDGVGEFNRGKIILTTEPGKEVKATLREKLPSSFIASFDLQGSVMGRQSIYLQPDDEQHQINIMLEKNELFIYKEKPEGEPQLIFEQPLNEISWSGHDYAFNKATKYDYLDTQKGSRIDEEKYPITLKNNRHVAIIVENGRLRVEIDHKNVAEVEFPSSSSYQLVLGGSTIPNKNSHEQDIDTIFDSIFEDLTVYSDDDTIYTVHETKSESFLRTISKKGSNIIDFFIEKF